MTPSPLSSAEQVSALADGQLQGAALSQALQDCEQNPALLKSWRDYHLIGDVLRGVPALAPADEADFLERLRPALQTPPSPLEPSATATASPSTPAEAANDSRFRWSWVAAVALLAGVAWTLGSEFSQGDPSFAGGESPVWVASPQGVIMRDPALEELLDAHRQQGGAHAMPMPSGFLRNATFDPAPSGPGRGAASSR